MGNVFYWSWEEAYVAWFQHLGEGTILQTILFNLFNMFSLFGEETACVFIMGILYWGIDKKKGERLGFTILLADTGNELLKNIFLRLRPYKVSERISLLREVGGYSFPSGHSVNAAVVFSSLAKFYRKKVFMVLAVVMPIGVALSRNYLGAHWPTDVIVGVALGVCWMLLVNLMFDKLGDTTIYIICVVLGAVGFFYIRDNDYYSAYGMLLGLVAGRAFEKKFVNFENTKVWWKVAVRTACGGAIFLGTNTVIKMLIGGIFPEDTMGNYLLRLIRYFLVVFVLVGIYPMVFKKEKK